MDYAAHAAAAPPAADPHPSYVPHPYGYQYTYPAYHQPDPAAADPSAASSSYYYSNPTAPADAQAQYNPYANTYHYYDPSAVAYGGGAPAGYYFSAGEASQAPAVSAAQAAPAATGSGAGKHFGFDPQRYAQFHQTVIVENWTEERSFAERAPYRQRRLQRSIQRTLQRSIQRTLQRRIVQGEKLEKKKKKVTWVAAAKAPNGSVGASTAAAPAVAGGMMPAVQPKKNKSSSATPEDLEVKKRKVLEAGAAQGEVKICTACNVVVNSQKVYEFHLAGHKHKVNVQKQQQAQLPHVA